MTSASRTRGAVRWIAAAACGLAAAVLLLAPFRRHDFAARLPAGAYEAFYCAGAVLGAGGDPYTVEPLASCESGLPYHARIGNFVEPAPLPPFVLAAFIPLARIPPAASFAVFAALVVAAGVVTVLALRALTGLPWLMLGGAFLVGTTYHDELQGELPALAIVALVCGALLLERERPRAAALVALGALTAPAVAAPALLALFAFVPKSRLTLVASGIGAVALSVAVAGPAALFEYFARVLPAQAAAETSAVDQYSLTWVLHMLGAGDRAAVAAGSLAYLAACVAGIALAFFLARRTGRRAFLLLAPPAFAVIGGSYVHDIQLPIALPAALLLFTVAGERPRVALVAAIAILASVWGDGVTTVASALAIACVVAGAAGATRGVAAGVLFAAAAVLVARLPAGDSVAHTVSLARHPGGELASQPWAEFVRTTDYGRLTARLLVEKIVYFSASLTIAAMVVAEALRRSGAGATAGRARRATRSATSAMSNRNTG